MLKSTSKILQILCCLGTLLFFSVDASASHSMGLDLTYKCIGNNQYEVNLTFYRDCNGVDVYSTATVNWAATCGSGSVNLNQTSMVEITPSCPGIVGTACNAGGGVYGIEKYTFQGIITLPTGCTDITLSHSMCCRNYAITSLSSPGGELIYVEAKIENAAICNNSPVFTNDPVPFGCVGQPVYYNHGASDVDGDDLTYSLVDCMNSAGISVGYAAGYSATIPLSTTNGVVINPATGAITFTPNMAQVGVFCVLIEEHRNGVLIGSIIRDIQFTAVACSNNVPSLSGVNNTTDYTAVATVGNQLCFNVHSTDIDQNQSTFLSWNNAITGAVFTSSTATYSVGTFCWTPTANDVGVHTFTVTVSDDYCPIVGQNTYTYTITVPDNNVPCDSIDMSIVSTNDVTCSSSDGAAVILATNGVAPYDYQLVNWTTGEFFNNTSGIFNTLTPGSYSVWVEDANGCTPACTGHTFVIAGNAIPVAATAIGADVHCPSNSTNVMDSTNRDGSVTVTATGGTAPYLYSIDGLTFQSSGLFSNLGVGTYTAIVMDANGCSATAVATVNEPRPISIGVVSITPASCGLSNGSVTLVGSGGQGSFLYYINGQSQSSPTFTNLAAGTYTFSVCDMRYCLYDTTIVIPVGPSVVATAIGADVHCPSNSTNVMDSTNRDGSVTVTATNGTAPYTYSIDGSTFQNSNVFGNLGVGTYTVFVVDANGCSDTTTATVNEPSPISIGVVSITPETCGQSNGSITLTASGGQGSFLYYINGQSQSSPTFTNLAAGTYTFSVCDMRYCLYDTTIVIPDVPAFVAMTTTTNPSCEGDCNGTATAYGDSLNTYTVVWSNGQTGATISNLCAGTYTATVTDGNGCSSIATAVITDPAAISVSLVASSDETCRGNDGSATLSVTGGTAPYTVDLANFTTATTTSNATGLFTRLNAGNHVVNVIDVNGCSVNCATHFELEGCDNAPSGSIRGVRSIAGSVSLTINPNPASSLVQVSYQTNESLVTITILDANGKTVHTKAQTSGNGSLEIIINDWADGLYYVVMTDSDGELVKTEKLIIAK
ncbi:MAG: internalin, putative [uncultured Aureispira sp.]|uniref:Internalin, putative n=1 Tax=uncultured Aureispira sp. TaxID=1331704 RepID=A0A6S6UB11_9BACT|nr:MAG: internalin, putative [uncultured Aureispira sp.]